MQTPGSTWRCVWVRLAGALTLALSTITSAQNPPQAADQTRPDHQNIFVRDTGPLQEKLALAARLEQQQDWIKAAEILDEIEKNYPDRVVLTTADNQEPIRHYTSLTAIITRRISLWPAEGLAAYRAGYEVRAQALLQQAQAGDDSAWQQVYTRYFNTSAGLDAGIKLSDASFRQGHFLAAGEICQQLLDWHQLAKEQQPALLFRAALSYQLGGRTQQGQSYFSELKQHFADARLVIGGQEQLAAPPLNRRCSNTSSSAASPPRITGRHWAAMHRADEYRQHINIYPRNDFSAWLWHHVQFQTCLQIGRWNSRSSTITSEKLAYFWASFPLRIVENSTFKMAGTFTPPC